MRSARSGGGGRGSMIDSLNGGYGCIAWAFRWLDGCMTIHELMILRHDTIHGDLMTTLFDWKIGFIDSF